MPTVPTLLTFALAATLLIIVPGPNVIYIITRGIEQGRTAAIVSSLGVQTGMFVHIAAAMLGLSALVASSEPVFHAVKYAGAAYLIWMGWKSIRSVPTDLSVPGNLRRLPLGRLYAQGMIINVLNPKVGLFFLAFLPQFIDPARGGATTQVLALGLVFVTIALVSDGVYAMASGAIGDVLKRRAALARQRNRFSGAIYILLGAFAALGGSGSAKHS